MRTKTEVQNDLDNVRQAIDDIVQGRASQVSKGDWSLQHLSLDDLRKREKDLIAELNQTRGVKRHSVATFKHD